MVDLTKEEKQGLNLFKSKGKCAELPCPRPGAQWRTTAVHRLHLRQPGRAAEPGQPLLQRARLQPAGLFLDRPRAGRLPRSHGDYQQYAADNNGKQKVPTLRNVDKWDTALGYRSRRTPTTAISRRCSRSCTSTTPGTRSRRALTPSPRLRMPWPRAAGRRPEVPVNVNTKELGDLHLTRAQEDAIVAFMKTLSDGYILP